MEGVDYPVVVAHNLVSTLGTKSKMSKSEVLLYNQACSLLQRYLRFHELVHEGAIFQMEDKVGADGK